MSVGNLSAGNMPVGNLCVGNSQVHRLIASEQYLAGGTGVNRRHDGKHLLASQVDFGKETKVSFRLPLAAFSLQYTWQSIRMHSYKRYR